MSTPLTPSLTDSRTRPTGVGSTTSDPRLGESVDGGCLVSSTGTPRKSRKRTEGHDERYDLLMTRDDINSAEDRSVKKGIQVVSKLGEPGHDSLPYVVISPVYLKSRSLDGEEPFPCVFFNRPSSCRDRSDYTRRLLRRFPTRYLGTPLPDLTQSAGLGSPTCPCPVPPTPRNQETPPMVVPFHLPSTPVSTNFFKVYVPSLVRFRYSLLSQTLGPPPVRPLTPLRSYPVVTDPSDLSSVPGVRSPDRRQRLLNPRKLHVSRYHSGVPEGSRSRPIHPSSLLRISVPSTQGQVYSPSPDLNRRLYLPSPTESLRRRRLLDPIA